MSERDDSTETEKQRRWRTLKALDEAAEEHFVHVDERETNREAQALALWLVREIGGYFAFGGDPGENVRVVLHAMQRVTLHEGNQLTRARVVNTIGRHAKQYAASAAKDAVIDRCIRSLAVWDRELEQAPIGAKNKLRAALPGLLAAYDQDPRLKPGRKGAEKILAELIVDGLVGRLGLEAHDDHVDRADEVERIRKQLGSDVKVHPERILSNK